MRGANASSKRRRLGGPASTAWEQGRGGEALPGAWQRGADSELLGDDQVRVVYAPDEEIRSEYTEGRQSVRHQDARRGRRRAFVIRHHVRDGPPEGPGVKIDRVIQNVRRGVDLPEGSASFGSAEVQCEERAVNGDLSRHSQSSPSPPTETRVKMGTGGHALFVDSYMMSMVQKSSSRREKTSQVGPSSLGPRGGRRGARPPSRRRSVMDGRDKSNRGLGHKLLSQLADADLDVNNSTPNQVLDTFVSQIPAPSPDSVSKRIRMRPPVTLAQQVNTLDARLKFEANVSRGVSTLKLEVLRMDKEHGKLKCLCKCDHPMGVFEGKRAISVMKQSPDLGDIHPGASIIINKPWFILDGLVDGATVPMIFCLGDASRIS
jgi:hypothetical protein